MKTETNAEYVARATAHTFAWLSDRSSDCHPTIFRNLGRVIEMLGDYLEPRNSSASAIALRKLSDEQRAVVQSLIAGFIWAAMKR